MCFCTWFPLLLLELDMKIYLYAKTEDNYYWVINSVDLSQYDLIALSTIKTLDSPTINIHNKDNLDRALLLISLGLSNKEIEELLNDSN